MMLIAFSSFTYSDIPSDLNSDSVSYYALENLLDSTPNANTLTNNGAATISGKIDNAYNSTSSTTYIYRNYDNDFDLQTFTINLWLNTYSVGSQRTIISNTDFVAANGHGIRLDVSSGVLKSLIYDGVGGGSDSSSTQSSVTLTANTWHMITWTWDGSQADIFIDGAEITYSTHDSIATTISYSGANKFVIGNYWWGSWQAAYTRGGIDEILVLNRVVTQPEIDFLYNLNAPNSDQQYLFSSGASPSLTTTLVYPTNETHYNLINPLDPTKVFNGSLVTTTNNNANCTVWSELFGFYFPSNTWNNDTTSNTTQVYTNYTTISEKNFSVRINCTDGINETTTDFWFIVDNTDVTTSINFVNDSTQANEFNLSVAYFDNYLYRTNTTILRMSDNFTIYNNDSGVLGYETQWWNVTYLIELLNSTYIVGDYIKVILNATDTHTAKEFKEKPTSTKLTIFDKNIKEYNLKYGKFRLEYPKNMEIEEDYGFDRMHFKLKSEKLKNKNTYQYIEADKIVYYENSKYPCHMIINDKYWYDCIGMKDPKVTKEKNNRYKIDFFMDSEEVITKSLGGLNEINEEYIFKINKNYTGNIAKGDFFNPSDTTFNYTSLYNFTVSSLLVDEDCITITGSNVSSYDKQYCYGFNEIELEDVVIFAGATDIDCYVNISNSTGNIIQTNFDWIDRDNNILKNGFNLCDSNSYCTLDTLSGSLISSNDSITCQGIINNSWFNFSENSNTINTSSIGLCDNETTLIYPIANFTYFDELTNDVINVSASYDLTFYEGSSTFNIQNNGTGEYTSFCTDVNPSTAVFNLKLYDTIILSSPNYITRVFNIPFSQGLDVSNNPYYNYSYYLIQVANSTTITYTWENTEYAAISGIMQIYRCEDDGTRTLIESTNVANGKATANLQLFSTAYSYSFTKDDVTYTEPEYYDCHVESTELQGYTVNIAQIDVLPVVGLYLMDCHIYNVSSSIVKMEWDGNDEDATNIEACIVGYREDIYGRSKVYESCVNESSGSLTRNIALSGFNYYVQGTLEQNGVKGFCQETVEFNQRSSTSETLGINGIFLAAILIIAFALLGAGDNILIIIFSIIAILIVSIIGIVSFGWITIISIILIGIILALVYRYTLKGV